MNDLEKYFRQNDKRIISKWMHYFEVYDRHFSRFRNKKVAILEIGVSQGGSLQMWKDYFGEGAKIYGIDVNPKCKDLEEENIKIFIGSQSDKEFLNDVKRQTPPIDILIDDGGHSMIQQIVTFNTLFDHVKEDGVYLCEDVHTSYWLTYGGGHKRRGTFIEFSKNWIDDINAWHSEQKSLKVNAITKWVKSVHYYDSMVVLEKGKMEMSLRETTGNASFDFTIHNTSSWKWKMKSASLTAINKLLRIFRLKGFIWR